MALETVTITVSTDDIVPVPVPGVVVRVFDSTGATYITEATTDVNGDAQFTLPGDPAPAPIEYQLRFYVVGGSIKSPQFIEVFSPPADSPTGTNNFGIEAHLRTLPEGTDPRLCRISGIILGPDGRPRPGIDIHFVHLFNPVIASPDTVLGERAVTRSKRDGSVVIDLWRKACYLATVESHENIQREVEVPDRAAMNIGDLLFPVVVDISWVPAPAPDWALSVGGTLDISPTITASNFQVLPGLAVEDVLYATDDPSVATVEVVNLSVIRIRGITAGTTQLRVTRLDTSILRTPDGISGVPVQIVVS